MSKNACIQCSIKECKHHCGTEDYCTLNQIKANVLTANPSYSEHNLPQREGSGQL